jgi:type VI secretion system protein ImpK
MRLDLTKTIAGKRGLNDLCTDLFLIVIRMREAEDLGEPAALRKLINYYLELFEKNCRSIKIDRESIEEAKYALIALIDETVLSVPGACRDFWLSRPLQLDHFGDNIAGEEFYNKLQRLLMQPERKKHALEVYYICLSLGFEGKYKIANAQERFTIMDDLGRKLRRTRVRVSSGVSPHGRRAESNVRKRAGKRMVPMWVNVVFGSLAIAGIWAALFVLNTQKANELIESLSSIVVR